MSAAVQPTLFDAAPSKPAPPKREPDLRPLHHQYALPTNGKGGRSFEVGLVRWRPETEERVDVRAMAYRLAFTWNMAEGIPVEALERGVVAHFYLRTLALVEAIEGGTTDAEGLRALAAAVRRAHDAHRFDLAPDAPASTLEPLDDEMAA